MIKSTLPRNDPKKLPGCIIFAVALMNGYRPAAGVAHKKKDWVEYVEDNFIPTHADIVAAAVGGDEQHEVAGDEPNEVAEEISDESNEIVGVAGTNQWSFKSLLSTRTTRFSSRPKESIKATLQAINSVWNPACEVINGASAVLVVAAMPPIDAEPSEVAEPEVNVGVAVSLDISDETAEQVSKTVSEFKLIMKMMRLTPTMPWLKNLVSGEKTKRPLLDGDE
ncbi:uncharacterized protein LOC132200247 [Neocloeon triangulifer]|uniref:uncharacterized protein LOC132200247 n=1 Tax=Neocloeon triangulifer TaxID=2078957 RepID=UPI00286F8B07|nr:uncharacterized protein LOC132200247 [Neocloeon triangulifer]XP_059481558.1 uncharacterized protein LOC132200247 [Neocloeon triangulifer]